MAASGGFLPDISGNDIIVPLVSIIKKHPQLWDFNHVEYNNQSARIHTWIQIATSLLTDFDMLSEADRIRTIGSLQSKWKAIKSSYIKYRNKKDGDRVTRDNLNPMHIYYEDMSFLEDRLGDAIDRRQKHVERKQLDREKRGLPGDGKRPRTDDDEGSKERPSKRRTEEREKQLLGLLKECIDREKDDNRAFLMSTLPILKQFNDEQKWQFRQEVLNLLIRLQSVSYYVALPKDPNPPAQVPSASSSSLSSLSSSSLPSASLPTPSPPSSSSPCPSTFKKPVEKPTPIVYPILNKTQMQQDQSPSRSSISDAPTVMRPQRVYTKKPSATSSRRPVSWSAVPPPNQEYLDMSRLIKTEEVNIEYDEPGASEEVPIKSPPEEPEEKPAETSLVPKIEPPSTPDDSEDFEHMNGKPKKEPN